MIDISICDHCLQSVFGVTRGEFILDVFIPTIGEGFLGGRQSGAREVPNKEFQRAQVRQFRRVSIVVLAARTAERVILIRIIVNCDQWV